MGQETLANPILSFAATIVDPGGRGLANVSEAEKPVDGQFLGAVCVLSLLIYIYCCVFLAVFPWCHFIVSVEFRGDHAADT